MDFRSKPTPFLKDIVKSSDFAELLCQYPTDKAELKAEAKRLCNDVYEVQHGHYGVSQSFFGLLTEVPVYPILLLYTILGLTTLGMIPLILTVVALAGAALIAACIFFYATFREHQVEATKNRNDFRLTALKCEALKVLINRQEDLLNRKRTNLDAQTVVTPNYQLPIYSHLKQAVKGTMLITTSLFTMAEVGIRLVSVMMLSPVLLGIALGVSTIVGIGFGISQYQSHKEKERVTKEYEELTGHIKKMKRYAMKLEEDLNKEKTIRALEENIPIRYSGRSSFLRDSASSSPSPPPSPHPSPIEIRRRPC